MIALPASNRHVATAIVGGEQRLDERQREAADVEAAGVEQVEHAIALLGVAGEQHRDEKRDDRADEAQRYEQEQIGREVGGAEGVDDRAGEREVEDDLGDGGLGLGAEHPAAPGEIACRDDGRERRDLDQHVFHALRLLSEGRLCSVASAARSPVASARKGRRIGGRPRFVPALAYRTLPRWSAGASPPGPFNMAASKSDMVSSYRAVFETGHASDRITL